MYQSYLTQENEKGILKTNAQQSSFRRKSMLSRFVENEHSAKNHREFYAAQKQQPVSLYGIPAGQFSYAAGNSTKFNDITRSKMSSTYMQSTMLGRTSMKH